MLVLDGIVLIRWSEQCCQTCDKNWQATFTLKTRPMEPNWRAFNSPEAFWV